MTTQTEITHALEGKEIYHTSKGMSYGVVTRVMSTRERVEFRRGDKTVTESYDQVETKLGWDGVEVRDAQ